jgi:hypothetical protein
MSKVIDPKPTITPKVIEPNPTITATAPKPTIQQVINDPRELAEESPKPIVYNISLQLGDIIQLDAPSNSALHDKIYFIKFINKEKIVLIDAVKTITLTIGLNGKLEEESISNILLLSRHKSPSFVVQNNLEIKKYISIYFGEPLPKVLNGLITNIENDMIEVTTLPENEVLYIDFAYSGIPEHLNIEKIIIREKVDETKLVVSQSRDDGLSSTDALNKTLLDNDDQELNYDLKVYDSVKEYEDIIIDVIDLGVELGPIEHEVNVAEDEQRYSLDKQVNDYLDKLINAYLPEQRSPEVINKIHSEINYYLQLRTIYSNFDDNNNPSIIDERGEHYKYLKEQLFNLNRKLYYILPVVSNVRNLLINDVSEIDEMEDKNSYNYQHIGEFIETLNDVAMKWSNNSSKEKINNYKEHIKSLLELLDNNINYNEENINVNGQIEMVNSIVDDFYNYSVKKGELTKSRFLTDVYNDGYNMLETYYANNKKFTKHIKIVPNDFVKIIGFITLPLPFFNLSKLHSPYTNICDRANLDHHFIAIQSLLNKQTLYNKYVLENETKDDYINNHTNIHNNTLLSTINNFSSEESDLPYLESMNYLMESFVPTASAFIDEYVKLYNIQSLDHRRYNLQNFVYDLQPLNIDIYNLHVNDYKKIGKLVDANIDYYKKNYKANETRFVELLKTIADLNSNIYNNPLNNSKYNNLQFSFNILTKDLKAELFNFYKISEDLFNSNEELYSAIVKIDNAEFFMQCINKNIMDLVVGNLLENFIKAHSREKEEQEERKNQKQNQNQNLGQDDPRNLSSVDNLSSLDNLSSKDILKKDLDELQSTCESYILSKKYNSLQSLENDNNKLTYFDAIYDNTFYSIINDYKTERANMDRKQFVDFIANKLMGQLSLTKQKAYREAAAIVDEKREIIDGDYALLTDKTSNKNYIYIRVNNTWTLEPKFENNFVIETNQIFCNSNKDCISVNEKCMTNEEAKKANINKDVDEILKSFENKYDLSIEDIKGKINSNYENSKKRIAKIELLNRSSREKISTYLLSLSDVQESKASMSPYEKLRDHILKMKDLAYKYSCINKFCLNFTRNAIKDEPPQWLYCNQSGVRLIPSFFLKLANVFINKMDYARELDAICAERGTISDDNNFWVDKYSGYIIKTIAFDTEEGYDEKGFKLYTRANVEEDYNISVNVNAALKDQEIMQLKEKANPKSLNPNIGVITNIVNAMSTNMGINISHNHELLINNVLTIQNSNIPSQQQYEQFILKATQKEGKVKAMPTYKEAYNSSLLLLTLAFLVYCIQINIPSLQSKKTFPGCIKSFKGYPLDGEEDKTSIAYIACIASKLKSSIDPWSSLLKMSESTIMKKMEALIEKYILPNKELVSHLNKKRAYLLSEDAQKDAIPEYLSINNWHTFNPPLNDVIIMSENVEPLDETFKTILYDTFSRGSPNNIKETLEAKAIYSSYYIIEKIQNIVKKNSPLLKNSNDNPFLENACCNSSKNTIDYFISEDKSIATYNNYVAFYNNILASIDLLTYAPQLYDPRNTKQKRGSTETSFSEELVYKAFIHFCNFNNQIPLDDELRGLCLDKPAKYDNSKPMKDIISSLKDEGKVYNFSAFVELIHIISKRNIIHVAAHFPILNNIEAMRILIEAYRQNSYYNLDDDLITNLEVLLDNFSITADENSELRNFKNFIGKSNVLLKQNILQIISKQSSISKSDVAKFSQNLAIQIDVENIKFHQNYIINFLYIFPSIISNKNINYGAIPKHWKLSEIHVKDLANIIQKYYNNLNNFNVRPELLIAFKIIAKRCKILVELMRLFLYDKNLMSSAKSTVKINSIFDEQVVTMFYNFIFYKLINELVNISEDEEFLLEIQALEINDYAKDLFLKNSVAYVLEYINIMSNHYNLVNNGYKKVKEKINMAKEKEKTIITDFLKNLSDEEREIENILKNNKLEKWNKGMQKGLTQYVKENYDEEREALEKQALKERKLQQNNNVTAMNRELYNLDNDEDEARGQAIDEEEYSLSNVPDDDDFNYDNDQDGDYSNGPDDRDYD